MHTSGGRVSTVINGVAYSARGVISLQPSNITVEVDSNQDGSNFRTNKAKPRKAKCTFDRFVDDNGTPLRWSENIMLMINIPFTFIEQDTGVTHLLTNGCFTGDPDIDLSTGEVSNLEIAADNYKTIT
ncbi:phage tail tube protein [Rhodopseudomonas sp. HC1]|uniref:phage tail tube protein n=1 Tax=Rhodopseudomonas infernalis TaxID=2897386 RepID=UPI001EE95B51|nr:phage tail tube protein [Rhodopseudomonas infernalis]MCG6204198.1 phage tail tube protein [Rhodopseudomonas infernalis]